MALTRTLTLYSGSDSLPTTDYTAVTDWPGTELAGMANVGEAAASVWALRDDDGVIPDYVAPGQFINSHNVVIATVGSNTLFRGRVAAQEHFRGRQVAGRAAEWTVTLEDQNSHLRGMVVDGWIRPAETDAARMQALVAGYLSGNYRATTNLNGSNYVVTGSNTITLPANTYTGVTPFDIAQELASNADKEAFVTIDNELAYFGHDYTGYASLLRISDDIADANSTTYAPWNPRGSEAGREQLSALRVYYQPGDGRTTQASTTVSNNLASTADFWEEVYWDSTSQTSAQAIARAQKALDYRSQNEVTYSCSIGPMSGDEIWKIKPGQTIQFKSRGARGGRNANGTFAGDSFQTVRIRELRWTLPAEDLYIAHLELERPKRIHSPSSGSQALTIMPTPAPVAQQDQIVNPTIYATWTYINSYPAGGTLGNRDDSNTYGGGADRHVAGTSGLQVLGYPDKWWDPADAALGGFYGKSGRSGSSSGSDFITAAALTAHYFSVDCFWIFSLGKSINVECWDNSMKLSSQVLVTGAGRILRTLYHESTTFTTVAGTTRIKISWPAVAFSKLLTDNMQIGVPGSVVLANNPPYAISGVGGGSPYYARSDDPRLVPPNDLDKVEAYLYNNTDQLVEWGDVVALDPSLDDAIGFNTTLAYSSGWLGVAQEQIGSNSQGRILLSGYTPVINVGSNSTARGQWLYGSNMARRAYGSNVRTAGAFAQALTTSVAPDAIIWSTADAPAALASAAFDAFAPAAIGTVSVGTAPTAAHRDHVHPTGAGVPTNQAFGDVAAIGSGPTAAMDNHRHGMPDDPDTSAGGTKYNPDNLPATAAAISEEFTSGALSSGWAWSSVPATTEDYTSYPNYGYFAHTTGNHWLTKAWSPGATDVTIACKLYISRTLTNSTDAATIQLGVSAQTGAGVDGVYTTLFPRQAAASSFQGYDLNTSSFVPIGAAENLTGHQHSLAPLWLMLQRTVSGPTWRAYISFNGITWMQHETTGSKSLTVAAVALRLADQADIVAVDWIRAWDSLITKVGA